jgi:hypothetical protein
MNSLIIITLLASAVIASVWVFWRWHNHERIERGRDRARLRVIEGQLAAMRAALRITVAEHAVRRAMVMHSHDPFENRTDHEEYRTS